MKARARKLIVDDRVYWVSLRHLHDVEESADGRPVCRGCRERLAIRRDEPGAAALVVTFVGGADGAVGDGINPSGVVIRWVEDWDERSIPHGVVARPSGVLNLHRPGVARAIIEEAIARGWDTVSALELDGWTLFESVRIRLGPNDDEEQHRRPLKS